MTVTLTATYRDTLAPETLTLIDKYVGENYDLQAMLVFIDEYSEESFQDHYEQYVELGEQYGFEPVDAWLSMDQDAGDLEDFPNAYIGEYLNPRDMAQEFFDGDGDVERLDYRIVIDWAETAEYLLDHEVDRVGDFYFRCSY